MKIPTGCIRIDRILEGGIPSESVSLIYGEAETGKTTLAMQCAVNCAKQGYKTLFVDCDGIFSAKRLSQIASGSFDAIADLIILMRPSSFKEQAAVVDRLGEYLSKNFALIVIDTITSLYRARVSEFPGKAFELNRELNRQLACLAQTAKMQKVAVLMVSQVRTAFTEQTVSIEPVGTRVLKFWADTIIDLKLTENPQLVRMVLEKSRFGGQPTTVALRMEESGIHECVVS